VRLRERPRNGLRCWNRGRPLNAIMPRCSTGATVIRSTNTPGRSSGPAQRFSALPQALAMASLDRPQVGRRALLKRALGVAALVPTAWLISASYL